MPMIIGLDVAAKSFLTASIQFQLFSVLFIGLLYCFFSFSKNPTDIPKSLPGPSLLSITPFFRQRFDFLNAGFQITGHSCYSFNLLNETVVVLSGQSARIAFLETRQFDLTEGFKVLSGAIPMVRGVTSDLQTRRIALIHKRLASVQRSKYLSHLLPMLVEDCRTIMLKWGESGTFDPFKRIYELTFQTTVRSLSCHELSESPAMVARLKALYDKLDTGTTPATVLLPWLPTPSMLRKLWATKEIYDIIVGAIRTRKDSGVFRDDTLQHLLDFGDENLVVVGFIIGLLVAGARATGTTASWLVTFLGAHEDWRCKARKEVETLLSFQGVLGDYQSISTSLSNIPLSVWETETPILDSIIKETLRVAQPHTAMRRNMGPDVHIDGKRVSNGAYVVYPFSDCHLNPNYYSDPWKWDPSRPDPPVNVQYGSIVWGAGKTTCLGQRLAKLELKLLSAVLVLGFNHRIVDSSGRKRSELPTPNWNDILLCRPLDPCYVKYERTSLIL